MKRILLLLALCGFTFGVFGQATNAPRTQLEALEIRTNTLIIKGFIEVGSVNCGSASVLVAAKEATDGATGEKALGASVVVRGRDGRQDTSYIDYDELEALVRALGLMQSPPWSQTAFPQVEVSYATRDGFRVASANTSRNGSMEGMVLSARNCVVGASLNLQQLIAFRSLIDNAKAKLDGIRPKSGL
jgi:hypothetical protein